MVGQVWVEPGNLLGLTCSSMGSGTAGHAVWDGIVPDRAGLCQEISELVLAAGIDLHMEACLEQVFHHAPAHDAHTDEGDFFHMVSLLSPGLRPRPLLVKVYHKLR